MKTTINTILAVMLFIACSSPCQSSNYDMFYNKHKEDKGVVSMRIPCGLINMFLDNNDNKELKETLDNIDNLKFFISQNPNSNLLPILKKQLSNNNYNDIVIINNGGNTITFKSLKIEDIVTEIILIIEDSSGFVVMSVKGNFTKQAMKEYINAVDIDKVTKK